MISTSKSLFLLGVLFLSFTNGKTLNPSDIEYAPSDFPVKNEFVELYENGTLTEEGASSVDLSTYEMRLMNLITSPKTKSTIESATPKSLKKFRRAREKIAKKLLKAHRKRRLRKRTTEQIQAESRFNQLFEKPLRSLASVALKNENVRNRLVHLLNKRTSVLNEMFTNEQKVRLIDALEGKTPTSTLEKRKWPAMRTNSLGQEELPWPFTLLSVIVLDIFADSMGILGIFVFLILALPFTLAVDLVVCLIGFALLIGVFIPVAIFYYVFVFPFTNKHLLSY